MDFQDLAWLFSSHESNRGIIRLNFDEAALLWKAVMQTAGSILEIGTRFGGSALLLSAAGGPFRLVTTIDIDPQISPKVQRMLERRPITVLRQNSRDSLPDNVDQVYGMAFIDGDHTYEGVKTDIDQHWGRIRVKGLVAFHDHYESHPGVMRVVGELLESEQAETWRDQAGSMRVLRKLK